MHLVYLSHTDKEVKIWLTYENEAQDFDCNLNKWSHLNHIEQCEHKTVSSEHHPSHPIPYPSKMQVSAHLMFTESMATTSFGILGSVVNNSRQLSGLFNTAC